MSCITQGSLAVPGDGGGDPSASVAASCSLSGTARSIGEETQRARMVLDGLCAWPRSLSTQTRYFVTSSAVVGDGENPWTWTLRCSDLSSVWEVVISTSAAITHMRSLDVPGDTISRYAMRVCESFRHGEVAVSTEGTNVIVSMTYGDVKHVYTLSDCSNDNAVGDFVEGLARNAADAGLFREQRDTAVRELARCMQQQQQQQQQQRRERMSHGDWRSLPRAGSRGVAAARQRKVNAAMARTAGGQMDPTRALLHPSAAKRARPTGAKIKADNDTKDKDDDDDEDDLL